MIFGLNSKIDVILNPRAFIHRCERLPEVDEESPLTQPENIAIENSLLANWIIALVEYQISLIRNDISVWC